MRSLQTAPRRDREMTRRHGARWNRRAVMRNRTRLETARINSMRPLQNLAMAGPHRATTETSVDAGVGEAVVLKVETVGDPPVVIAAKLGRNREVQISEAVNRGAVNRGAASREATLAAAVAIPAAVTANALAALNVADHRRVLNARHQPAGRAEITITDRRPAISP